MEDDCADCLHSFDAHRYLNTPTLECSISGCDCTRYVDPEEVD